jgi:uncharacterized protein HemY
VSLPLDNWQFWATTVIFIIAAAWLLRTILPVPILTRRYQRRKRQRRVNLTVKGRGVR